MIHLTENAIKKLLEISNAEGLEICSIRVKVVGGGCAGMTNEIMFDDQVLDTDEVFDVDDVKVVIDLISFQYLDNSTIDYLDPEMGGGFKFLNPNAKSSCGCGHSQSY